MIKEIKEGHLKGDYIVDGSSCIWCTLFDDCMYMGQSGICQDFTPTDDYKEEINENIYK